MIGCVSRMTPSTQNYSVSTVRKTESGEAGFSLAFQRVAIDRHCSFLSFAKTEAELVQDHPVLGPLWVPQTLFGVKGV